MSADLDRITQKDRAWFEANPAEVHRFRAASWSEYAEQEFAELDTHKPGHTLVVQVTYVRDGVRVRRFAWMPNHVVPLLEAYR